MTEEEKIPKKYLEYDEVLNEELDKHWVTIMEACVRLRKKYPHKPTKKLVCEAIGAYMVVVAKTRF